MFIYNYLYLPFPFKYFNFVFGRHMLQNIIFNSLISSNRRMITSIWPNEDIDAWIKQSVNSNVAHLISCRLHLHPHPHHY